MDGSLRNHKSSGTSASVHCRAKQTKIDGRIALFVTSRGGEGVLHSFGEGNSMSTID